MDLSMEQILWAFLLSALAGISTTIGAILVFFSKQDNFKVLSIGLAFSAGVMIYISFMEILPKAMQDFKKVYAGFGGEILTISCFFLGTILSAIVDKLVPESLDTKAKKEYDELKIDSDGPEVKQTYINSTPQNEANSHHHALKRTGVLTAFAIAAHNFPEGFATFVSSLESLSFGLAIAIAVAIHNIPEGMAVSLPIYHATGQRRKAFIYSALSGLTEPLGALVAVFLLLPFVGSFLLAFTFALIAGIMVYISFDELLPAARAYGEAHHCLYGLLVGMGVMALSLALLNNIN